MTDIEVSTVMEQIHDAPRLSRYIGHSGIRWLKSDLTASVPGPSTGPDPAGVMVERAASRLCLAFTAALARFGRRRSRVSPRSQHGLVTDCWPVAMYS